MSDSEGEVPAVADVQRWQAPTYETPASGPPTASRIAAIEQEAYAEGLRRGLDDGMRQGQEAALTRQKQLDALIAAIEPQSAIVDEALLAQLGELVIAIARQFVRRQLQQEPGEIVRVVREAIAALPAADCEITISLHPDDRTLVDESLQPDSRARTVRLVEDLSLSRGGARVETDASVVDATVEARIGAIAARIFGDEREANGDQHGTVALTADPVGGQP